MSQPEDTGRSGDTFEEVAAPQSPKAVGEIDPGPLTGPSRDEAETHQIYESEVFSSKSSKESVPDTNRCSSVESRRLGEEAEENQKLEKVISKSSPEIGWPDYGPAIPFTCTMKPLWSAVAWIDQKPEPQIEHSTNKRRKRSNSMHEYPSLDVDPKKENLERKRSNSLTNIPMWIYPCNEEITFSCEIKPLPAATLWMNYELKSISKESLTGQVKRNRSLDMFPSSSSTEVIRKKGKPSLRQTNSLTNLKTGISDMLFNLCLNDKMSTDTFLEKMSTETISGKTIEVMEVESIEAIPLSSTPLSSTPPANVSPFSITPPPVFGSPTNFTFREPNTLFTRNFSPEAQKVRPMVRRLVPHFAGPVFSPPKQAQTFQATATRLMLQGKRRSTKISAPPLTHQPTMSIAEPVLDEPMEEADQPDVPQIGATLPWVPGNQVKVPSANFTGIRRTTDRHNEDRIPSFVHNIIWDEPMDETQEKCSSDMNMEETSTITSIVTANAGNRGGQTSPSTAGFTWNYFPPSNTLNPEVPPFVPAAMDEMPPNNLQSGVDGLLDSIITEGPSFYSDPCTSTFGFSRHLGPCSDLIPLKNQPGVAIMECPCCPGLYLPVPISTAIPQMAPQPATRRSRKNNRKTEKKPASEKAPLSSATEEPEMMETERKRSESTSLDKNARRRGKPKSYAAMVKSEPPNPSAPETSAPAEAEQKVTYGGRRKGKKKWRPLDLGLGPVTTESDNFTVPTATGTKPKASDSGNGKGASTSGSNKKTSHPEQARVTYQTKRRGGRGKKY